MRKVLTALFVILATNVFALDNIWDMRYTFGPDSRPSPKLGFGFGARSDYDPNVLFPINLTSGLTTNFDVGTKVNIQTYDKMDHMQASLDIGGRFRFNSASFFELDGYFGLNRNNGSAIVLTLGSDQVISKNFLNYYEARAGFLDGVTGDGGYVKFALGMTPTLIFGRLFRCMVEVNTSGSAGHLRDDFMIDILPKFELTFGGTRVRLDFDIGVMQEKNNDRKGIGLYVMTAL